MHESIGQRLRRLRLEKGLSQRELQEPGISYAYISRIENDDRRPSVRAMRRLAVKLDVSAEYLEFGTDTLRNLLGAAEDMAESYPRFIEGQNEEPRESDRAIYMKQCIALVKERYGY